MTHGAPLIRSGVVYLYQGIPFVRNNHLACGRYSVRSALIGEIAAARPAGMMAAKNVHAASDPAAIVRAKGSQNDTP